MDERRFVPFYSKYTIICSLAYVIPVFFIFKNERFTDLWLMYIGNSCFTCLLLVSGVFVNKKLQSSASLRSLVIPGLRVITSSIITICILLGVLALMFRHTIIEKHPANYNGLFFALAVNAILVNFLVGTMAVTLGAVTIKTNQRNEKGQEIT